MGLTPPVVIIVTAIIYSYNSAWNVGDVDLRVRFRHRIKNTGLIEPDHLEAPSHPLPPRCLRQRSM